jgi:segregation and condensation protein A
MLTSKDRVQLVYSFLAILEMLQQQMIKISVGLGYNNFWIEQRGEDEEVMEDGDL